MEKSELEQNVAHSNKVVDRMSRNVEQLQWRIKNNYDVPVERLERLEVNLTSITQQSQDLIIQGETSPSECPEIPQPQLRYVVIVVRQSDSYHEEIIFCSQFVFISSQTTTQSRGADPG